MRRMVVRRQGVQWMDFLGVRQRFPCTGDLQPRLTISVSLIMHMHLHAMAQCSPSDTASFKLPTIRPDQTQAKHQNTDKPQKMF